MKLTIKSLKYSVFVRFVFFLSPQTPLEDQAKRKDAATVTDDFDALLQTDSDVCDIADKAKTDTCHVSDASTQTDKKLEYCFQCRYHHCHHHHVVVKDLNDSSDDVKTVVAVNHTNAKVKCSDKECASATIGGRNVCAELKDFGAKEPLKIEDRPKWGVNRPLQQYVKASERDPFYLRNKRKKHPKRQFSDDQNRNSDGDGLKDDSNADSRSISPNPSIITNSTVTLSSPQLKNRKRSICTEILPIKTDINGRVYLNFNGASLQVTEDDRPSSKRPQTIRMTNRQMANEIRSINGESDDKNAQREKLID